MGEDGQSRSVAFQLTSARPNKELCNTTNPDNYLYNNLIDALNVVSSYSSTDNVKTAAAYAFTSWSYVHVL